MTPTELVDLIRKRHNVVGDSFWSDDEILQHVYDACLQLAREAFVIEAVTSQLTTAGTQAYAYPSNVIAIKRVTYNGQKLMPISMREDDQLTGFNAGTTSSGVPQFYFVWNDQIYLRQIPNDSTATLQVFSFNEPSTLTTSSTTLDIPTQFQIDTADYAIAMMSAKEQNFEKSQYFMNRWDLRILKAKQWHRKRLRADGFSSVVDVESASETFIGTV
ncbi:MAG: hypothetical protein V4440_03990 [Pseudomonadota bacterium]